VAVPAPAHDRQVRFKPFEAIAVVLGVGIIAWLDTLTGDDRLPFLVPSLAATAVILLIEPRMSVTRGWNAIGGQTVSALSGWVILLVLDDAALWIVAPLAVGLALIAMRAARCLHPPGAATAVIIVLLAEPTWERVLVPVLVGSCVIVAWVALVHAARRRWEARRGSVVEAS